MNRLLSFSILVFLSSCMLEPSDELPRNTGSSQLRFVISNSNFGILDREPKTISFAFFNVVDGEKGERDGEPIGFPVNRDSSYTLNEVPVGDKIIVIELLDENGSALARGETKVNIKLGPQTLEKVVLIPLTSKEIVVDTSFNIQLSGFPGYEESALKIFTKYCTKCHNRDFASGQLWLDKPIGSSRPPLDSDFELLVAEIFSRVESEDRPMPPKYDNNPVSPEDAANLRSWKKEVFGENPWAITKLQMTANLNSESTTVNFLLENGELLPDKELRLLTRKTYELSFSAFAEGDLLLDKWTQSFSVPADGKLIVSHFIEYKTPSITVPVEVGSN